MLVWNNKAQFCQCTFGWFGVKALFTVLETFCEYEIVLDIEKYL